VRSSTPAGKADQLRVRPAGSPHLRPNVILFSSPPVPAPCANGSDVRLSFHYIFLRLIFLRFHAHGRNLTHTRPTSYMATRTRTRHRHPTRPLRNYTIAVNRGAHCTRVARRPSGFFAPHRTGTHRTGR